MKIDFLSSVGFCKIKEGDIFSCDDEFYIKIHSIKMDDDDEINAINLKDGTPEYYYEDKVVTNYPNAKLII